METKTAGTKTVNKPGGNSPNQPKAAQQVTKPAATATEANKNLADFAKGKNAADAKKADEKAKTVKAAKDGRPKLPPLPRKASAAKPLVDCACGCGLKTRSKFAPGHDSRLRGWALRLARGLTTLAAIEEYAGKGEREAVEAFVKELKKEGKYEALKTPQAVKIKPKKVVDAEDDEDESEDDDE